MDRNKSLKLIVILIACALCVNIPSGCNRLSSNELILKSYDFKYKDIIISADANMSELLSALGKPISYDEAPSCAFEGMDKLYRYNGFEIRTYPDGKEDLIYQIIFLNDLVSTQEGIRIGSTRKDVISSYGDDYTALGSTIIYKSANCNLQFIFRDGKVSAIVYKSQVN